MKKINVGTCKPTRKYESKIPRTQKMYIPTRSFAGIIDLGPIASNKYLLGGEEGIFENYIFFHLWK